MSLNTAEQDSALTAFPIQYAQFELHNTASHNHCTPFYVARGTIAAVQSSVSLWKQKQIQCSIVCE